LIHENIEFFAEEDRLSKLSQLGDQLEKLNSVMDWEIFESSLEGAYDGTANSSGLIAAYTNGWDSVDNAIKGGAGWIALHYVNSVEQATDGSPNHYDQKTLYEMKWDPYGWVKYNSPTQYAVDINWSHEISAIIKQNAYLFGNDRLTFIIPKYN
jgi:beta-N-acetylglucosaminidase